MRSINVYLALKAPGKDGDRLILDGDLSLLIEMIKVIADVQKTADNEFDAEEILKQIQEKHG